MMKYIWAAAIFTFAFIAAFIYHSATCGCITAHINYFSAVPYTSMQKAKTKEALSMFYLVNKRYPETNEGLIPLIPEYLQRYPLDSWRIPIGYSKVSEREYKLFSVGQTCNLPWQEEHKKQKSIQVCLFR